MPGIRRGFYFGGTRPLPPSPTHPTNNAPDEEQTGSSETDFLAVLRGTHKKKSKSNNRNLIGDGYNSDDQRLIQLKMAGNPDHVVRQKLIEEGRVIYTVNTIGSRFRKLRDHAAQKEDEMLDDELTDWHEGEDDLLEDTLRDLDEKYEQEYQKLVDRKWKEVSDTLAHKMQIKKYTANACKDRWAALQDGTALLPIELDEDKEGRRILRETRIAANKKRRADAEATENAQKNAIEAKRNAKQAQMQASAKEKREKRKIREADRSETKRLQEERRVGRERERAEVEEAKRLWNTEICERRRIRQLEERFYRNLTGRQLNRMRQLSAFDDEEEDEEIIPLGPTDDNEDEEGYITDAELAAELEAENAHDEMIDLTRDREEDVCASPSPPDINIPTKPTSMLPTKARVTPATLANPRSVLTDAELEVLLFQRGLPRRTVRESHPELVARVAAADDALSLASINALLEKYFDRAKGNKAQKLQRLAQHDADNSTAGAQGVRATDLAFMMQYEGYQGEYAKLLR